MRGGAVKRGFGRLLKDRTISEQPNEILPDRAYSLEYVAEFLRTTTRAVREDLITPGHLKVFKFKRGKETVIGRKLIECIATLTEEGFSGE